MKRREAKSKGKKERYKHLNTEFQRIAKRDKKAFLSDQCKEIEENNRNDRMISVPFQGKPLNMAVVQVYAPTSTLKKLKLNGSLQTYQTF